MKGITLYCMVVLVTIGVTYSSSTGTPVESTTEKVPVETSVETPAQHTTNGETSRETEPTTQPTDKPTTTTLAPAPSVAPSEELGQWHVNHSGQVCILFTEALEMEFVYQDAQHQNLNKTIYVPANAMADGTCNDNHTQVMNLTFYDGEFIISYTFYRPNPRFTTTEYYVHEVHVFYDMTEKYFPGIAEQAKGMVASLENQTLYQADMGETYLCNTSSTLSFQVPTSPNYLANMTHKDLQTEAFREDAHGLEFSSNIVRCGDDLEVNNIVPIAVGAALAALVVIVLIAYLIGRRTRKRGYESV